ncbi:MAG: pyrroline-5-carboxylate reductase [Clostridia bacterium]|nr:pyrroline-5-carboxylate reductase [Clostridia bacterium]
MFKFKAGFVGAGNMGASLAKAICKKLGGEKVLISCKDIDEAREVGKRLSCNYGTSNDAVVNSKFVFLGIKPQGLDDVANALKADFDKNKDCIIVSMLAGVKTSRLENLFGEKKVIRIMPNTPAAVGEGMILVCGNSYVTQEDMAEFMDMMSMCGSLDLIDEELIDAGTAVSGCGPAFVYMFIDALADAGVKCGLSREQSVKYAAQTLIGSANMVVQTGIHPHDLKVAVCSPGGSTIEGVKSLENDNFKDSVIRAVEASYNKTKMLG